MGKFDRMGPRDMYTGHMSEIDMLGKPKLDRSYIEAYKAAATPDGYVPLKKGMALVREHYKGDPMAPDKPFANQLRMAIVEGLGLDESDDPEESDRVRFYSSVGSGALDFKHGVDGWFELVPSKLDRRGRSIVLMIDVTRRDEDDKPDDSYQDDRMVVSRVPDASDGSKEFMDIVYDQYGAKAVKKIRHQIDRENAT
jgi:hypothetical protein